jgi:hypothetical protein
MGALDEDEFLNFLNRVARHALVNERNLRGVDIQAFIGAVKAARFAAAQLETWRRRIADTFDVQRELLFSHALAASTVEMPARRSSLTSRSCKVPNARSTRPFACGLLAQRMSIFSSVSARPNCVAPSPPAACLALRAGRTTGRQSPPASGSPQGRRRSQDRQERVFGTPGAS